MIWRIPAKTFLLGEYAALAGEPSIVLTTKPCFELVLTKEPAFENIHPDSPAGRWWKKKGYYQGLLWRDPYQGLGGLGASSAQFLGVFLASCQLDSISPTLHAMLEAYYISAWQGEGLKPSGYDVLAQTQHCCVYINRNKQQIEFYNWVFNDIAFLLLHTGQKLATHSHLKTAIMPSLGQLATTVEKAKAAFSEINSDNLIEAVSCYQKQLEKAGLIASHSLELIGQFNSQPDVLAVKGCGALGADVILLIVRKEQLTTKVKNLKMQGLTILATSEELYTDESLVKISTKHLNF